MKKKLVFLLVSTLSLTTNVFAGNNIWEKLYKVFETKENITKKDLVINFCDVLANNPKINSFDASKSIFLKSLCNKTNLYTDKDFAESIEINSSFEKYLNLSNKNLHNNPITKSCTLDWYNMIKWSLNHIDFSCVSEQIFDNLASDILNIISAKAYWFNLTEENLIKWQEKLFWNQVCKKWNYLSATLSSKVSLCNHPFTFKYIKNTSKSLKSLLNNLSILNLNGGNISDFLKELWYKSTNSKLDVVNDTINLKNLIYNELFFYNLFLVYYKASLENQNNKFKMLKVWTNAYETIQSSQNKQIKNIDKLLYLSNTIIKKSFVIVKDIYWTFPIHIWLMAVLEDLDAFRRALAKIYTPLDQLRYKLKNVQDLDLK